MKKLVAVLVMLCALLGFTSAYADEEEESAFFGELQVSAFRGNTQYVGEQLYVEAALPWENYTAWISLYHEPEFKSAYVGVARTFGNFQIAIGAGPARYDGTTRTATSGWFFYLDKSSKVEALALFERYRHDENPWFYKGYVKKHFGEMFFAGVYGEKYFGVGPTVGATLYEKVQIEVTMPVVSKPANKEEGSTVLLKVAFSF